MNPETTITDALIETYCAAPDIQPEGIAEGMAIINKAFPAITVAARARIAFSYVLAAYNVQFEPTKLKPSEVDG